MRTNDPKGVPRPVVKSTSWQPERASAEAATRSLPGACKRFNPGFVTGCAEVSTSTTGCAPPFCTQPSDFSSRVVMPPFLLPGEGFS